MTTNVRIEKVCSAAVKIRVQAQELTRVATSELGSYAMVWQDSGEAVILAYAFDLTSSLMLHDSRRYVITEVK